MHEGLIIAASGGIKQQSKLDILANNLANINNAGFKSDGVIFREIMPPFKEDSSIEAGKNALLPPNDSNENVAYVAIDSIYTNHSQGVFNKTDNPLDMALEGEGFFQVETPQGQRYTRNGNFRLDTKNYLVTQDGNYILDTNNQKIKIEDEGGQIDVGTDGTITVGKGFGNQPKGKIGLVKFEDPTVLAKEGNGLYKIMDNEANPIVADDIRLTQGSLERSNVNSIEEMTKMITTIRAFEAYQKIVQTLDEADDKAVNSIGRLV
jgi:flagellar basal-body rod protein FlgF